MISCSRKIHFCAGHRVAGHENKCARLHGHNYLVWVYAEAKDLDGIGRVIDFSVLKDRIGGWIEKNWDHRMILWKNDPALGGMDLGVLNEGIVLVNFNPTAEKMGQYLLEKKCPRLLKGTGVTVTKIEVYETENCKAVVEI